MKNKHNTSDKVLSIRVPEPMFDKFKELCDANYKSMSDTIRDFIRERMQSQVLVRFEDGSLGVINKGWMISQGDETIIPDSVRVTGIQGEGSIYGKKCQVVKAFTEQGTK